jgi:hypothetical protein
LGKGALGLPSARFDSNVFFRDFFFFLFLFLKVLYVTNLIEIDFKVHEAENGTGSSS